MTDVNCFASDPPQISTTPTKNVSREQLEPTSPFVLRAPSSRAKSKLILQNMEEVLNTVKQQHREKHKRKREEKRRAAAAAAKLEEKPQPLKENGEKTKPATNVFELMMKARNRSLGVNEGGKEVSPDATKEANTPLSKRKQMLEEWNERKGGAKRRLADEQRGEVIEQQMEQRAKRLKKMLTQEASSAPTLPLKRGRGRPSRIRRLSSTEQLPDTPKTDKETEEFLSKLSSPTKKKDSLLGYFNKVVTPTQDTPKRRPRRRKESTETPKVETPASGRPRRSCAGKARYDYDLESASPSKETKKDLDNSIEIIDLDLDSQPLATPKKLAPLFVKQVPKPSPDPNVLKARKEFLQSGVPERIRLEQSKQKLMEQQYEESYEMFPKVTHVGCLPFESQAIILSPKWSWRQKEHELEPSPPAPFIWPFTKPLKTHRNPLTLTILPQLQNKREFVKLWKNEFERFPTFKCYNQMREKYRHFSALDSGQDTQQLGESFVVTRSSHRSLQKLDLAGLEEAQPPASALNGELLFTEKYKPLLFEQVLVNLSPVQELKDFLSSWSQNGSQRNSQTLDDSNFEMDSSSMSSANSNTMVLVGPCSSGKTSAVFALANDLNFNVLEINAGMKRTGKKLMQELQEATQSHQIRKDSKGGSSQQLLSKLQKSSDLTQEVRKSLILIEDADILFDHHDAGFTDAIYSLAASSKRPVIVVASNPNCSHLQRLMQQNCIHFQSPNALNISRFLAVLSLMENCPIELDELISLYLFNSQNLRKTLMELQFYIQSGGDSNSEASPQTMKKSPTKLLPKSLPTLDNSHIHRRLFEFYTCPQNVTHRIPFPVNFNLLRLNLSACWLNSSLLLEDQAKGRVQLKRKSRSPKKAWLENQEGVRASTPLDTLALFYENISIASQMDAALHDEDQRDRLQPLLTEEISHLLVEQALLTGLKVKEFAYNLFDKPSQRHSICDHMGNYQLRSSSVRSLDYEPALRSICRSEKERSTQERRSSRFYHYLRNYMVNVTSFSLDSLEEASQVFQEARPETNSDAAVCE